MSETIFGLHAAQSVLNIRPHAITRAQVLTGRADARLQTVLDELAAQNINVKAVPRQVLDELSNQGNHQGIVLTCQPAQPLNEAQLYERLDELEAPPFLLILDQVQDPHNLGACLRSADAAGVHAVIVTKDRAASLNATVRKVACGAAETVPLVQVTNLARTLRQLRERNIWLIGAAGEAEKTLFRADLTGSLALVMGAEGQGLRRLTREHCDGLVNIPMAGNVSSLNVSVATGVCLFEAVRQRLDEC